MTATIYLAVHHRQHPHGVAINRASIVTLGGPGVHGPERHATHAYVVLRTGDVCLRLDGDVPRASFGPWGASFGVPQAGNMAPLLWRAPVGADAVERMLSLAHDRPAYDPTEIGQAALTALRSLLENMPIPFAGNLGGIPGFRSRDQVHDAVRRAMICTRLASRVLGISPPDLYPETMARMVGRLGWSGPHLPGAVEAGRA